MPQTIAVALAAQRLGLSESTIRHMIEIGQLRGWRRTPRSPWHIFTWSVDDFIDAAEERYVQALEIDRAYVPSMTALTRIYQNRGDWLKAAKMMVQAETATSNMLEKTRLLHQAGMIYLDKLEDKDTAKALLLSIKK